MVFGCIKLVFQMFWKTCIVIIDMDSKNLVLLIRHSAVQLDQSRPAHDWTISEEGRTKCELFSRKLNEFQLSTIISSREIKAVETAQTLATLSNLPIKTVSGLEEQKRTTAPFYNDVGDFKKAIENLFNNPDQLVFGEETANEALYRFQNALKDELAFQPNSNLAFVTHGTVMTLFICHHNLNLSPISLWNKLTLPCAAVLNRANFKLINLILS